MVPFWLLKFNPFCRFPNKWKHDHDLLEFQMASTPSKDYKRLEREQKKRDKRRAREEAKAEKLRAAEAVAKETEAEG